LNDAATSGEYGAVWSAVENLKFDKLAAAEQVVARFSEAVALNDLVVAEVEAVLPNKLREAEELASKVRQQLTDIGNGIESMPAWPDYAAGAERQLDQLIRTNTRVMAANAAAHDARVSRDAAVQDGVRLRRGMEAAKNYLHAVVVKSIAE